MNEGSEREHLPPPTFAGGRRRKPMPVGWLLGYSALQQSLPHFLPASLQHVAHFFPWSLQHLSQAEPAANTAKGRADRARAAMAILMDFIVFCFFADSDVCFCLCRHRRGKSLRGQRVPGDDGILAFRQLSGAVLHRILTRGDRSVPTP